MTHPAMLELGFDAAHPRAALDVLQERPAVFALCNGEEQAEPYIGRTMNLKARLERLLIPSARHPKRLQLAALVKKICWRPVGSEFEAQLTQLMLLSELYSERAVERMHLRQPYFVRYMGSNQYPRLTVTSRRNLRESQWFYGPFASRAAAEKYVEEVLKLFLLRRCTRELHPALDKSGCVYAEMKMCLAPCTGGCSDQRYAEEAAAVEHFLATRGQSRLESLRARRERASAALDFETAARTHAMIGKIESLVGPLPELVQPLSQLRAVILQTGAEPHTAAIFLFAGGWLRGPLLMHSLKSQETEEPAPEHVPAESASRQLRQVRESWLAGALQSLAGAQFLPLSPVGREAHLALLKRWYYRPEAKRPGEIFFPDAEGNWPIRSILRGVERVVASSQPAAVSAQPPAVSSQSSAEMPAEAETAESCG